MESGGGGGAGVSAASSHVDVLLALACAAADLLGPQDAASTDVTNDLLTSTFTEVHDDDDDFDAEHGASESAKVTAGDAPLVPLSSATPTATTTGGVNKDKAPPVAVEGKWEGDLPMAFIFAVLRAVPSSYRPKLAHRLTARGLLRHATVALIQLVAARRFLHLLFAPCTFTNH